MTEPTTDPVSLLEEEARRQRLETEGANAISSARAKLVLQAGRDAARAFFAAPALKLETKPSWEVKTACTDGKLLLYNPAWFAGLANNEGMGVVAHETMHCMLGHHARQEGRDLQRWNQACDLAVNPLLQEARFDLPAGRLMPGEGPHAGLEVGLSAEEYYHQLPRSQKPEDDDGEGEGDDDDGEGEGDDPGGCGGVTQPGDGSEADCRQSEAEWQVATAQAKQVAEQLAKGQRQGTLPAWLERLVQAVLAPKVDWKDALRQFVSSHARNDYSWASPNRRFIHQGIYLPGLRSEELGDVVLAVDTSGSIGQDMLDRFAGEAQGILEAYDCSLTILYCDARIHAVETWQSSDGPLKLKALGGGGTNFRPVFDWLEKADLSPACLVYLTDLYGSFPDKAPNVPVLWAVVGKCPTKPPFGQKVEVKE
jgi:predicted metal-dependent peptidase